MQFLFELFVTDVIPSLIDIALLSVGFYYLLLLFRGTRAMHVLKGLALFGLVFWLSSPNVFDLKVVHYVLLNLYTVLLILLVVVFQPEVRRALARLGQSGMFGQMLAEQSSYLEEIVRACSVMSKRRVGALIAITRRANLQGIVDTGIPMDSLVKAEILTTIFTPYSTLHDGAVIIRDGRISSASCMLPLTEKLDLDKSLGTRHRAGIGLTEENDSVVIIVSEETGTISVAVGGRLTRDHDRESLSRLLTRLMNMEVE